jgi:hypothetical protein
MPVGAAIGSDQVNNIITSLAVRMRDLMTDVADLNLAVNGQGAGLAYLQAVGYSNAANPANPGSVSDAALALSVISYLNTVAGVYFGTATQGTQFSFNQQLSMVWAGRIGSP